MSPRLRNRGHAADTTVSPEQSRMEIERLISKHKCTQYMSGVDYKSRKARVQFTSHDRIVRFEVMLPDPTIRGNDQKERQRWRQLLLVIKAKLEAVTYNISTFEEEFLAHIVMPGDATVGELLTPIVAHAYRVGGIPEGVLTLPALPAKGETGEGRG